MLPDIGVNGVVCSRKVVKFKQKIIQIRESASYWLGTKGKIINMLIHLAIII
jgi:hypothetical protein